MSSEPERLRHNLTDPHIAALIVGSARDYAIITMDEDGVITGWSPGAERVFGYDPNEAVGMNASSLFAPSDVAAGADRQERAAAERHGRAEDSRWHFRKNGERFWGNGLTTRLRDGGVRGYLKVVRDETAAKMAEQQRVLLLNELNHRIKNTLATVQAIAEQTLRAGGVDAATRERLSSRLVALSEAHNLLVAENWAGADLQAVVSQTLAAHISPEAPRLHIDGPTVRLSPQQAVTLSLTLHELTTNAIKYGALSGREGHVWITWNLAQDGGGRRYMSLLWREAGGPPAVQPEKTGFGTMLIQRTFGREGGGRARIEYLPEGARCLLELPLSESESHRILDVASERLEAEA